MEIIVRPKATGFMHRITGCVVITLFVANPSVCSGTQKHSWTCQVMGRETRTLGNRVTLQSFIILYKQGSIFSSLLLLLFVLP